ncbi:hypothetical protein GYMLUDRAFT_67559 [Collybiopsis luxurians FD-317 M1]|nr:hypothetical protein GYMLUDRAFT_67559 [Collybiopsis luxurians FD-317 M1]
MSKWPLSRLIPACLSIMWWLVCLLFQFLGLFTSSRLSSPPPDPYSLESALPLAIPDLILTGHATANPFEHPPAASATRSSFEHSDQDFVPRHPLRAFSLDSNSTPHASANPFEYPPAASTTRSSSEREHSDEDFAPGYSLHALFPAFFYNVWADLWQPKTLSEWLSPYRLVPSLMVFAGNLFTAAHALPSSRAAFVTGLILALGTLINNIRPPSKVEKDELKNPPSEVVEESPVAAVRDITIHPGSFFSSSHDLLVDNADFDVHPNKIISSSPQYPVTNNFNIAHRQRGHE